MTKKYRQLRQSRIYRESVLSDMLSSVSNNYEVVTIKDNKRIEAQRLINKWNGINVNNIDMELDQIKSLHSITTRILSNIEYVEGQNSMLSYMSGKFSNINGIIDTYNDFIDKNQFVTMKYSRLEHIDLKGVLVV